MILNIRLSLSAADGRWWVQWDLHALPLPFGNVETRCAGPFDSLWEAGQVASTLTPATRCGRRGR